MGADGIFTITHSDESLPRQRLFIVAIALFVGLEYFDSTCFSFFASYIAGGVNASADELVWSTSVYAITSVLGILQQSWFVQRIGYRWYLTLCLMGFSLGSAAFVFADSSGELALARAVQGYSMGPMLSACRILLQISLKGKARGIALRLFLFNILLASASAPLVGGYLISYFGWRAPFTVMACLGSVLALLAFAAIPEKGKVPPEQQGEGHFWPYILFTVAICALQTAMQQVEFELFTSSPSLPALVGLGILSLSVFTYHQWNHPRPLINLRAFDMDIFRTGLVMYMFYYYISNSLGFLVSRMLEGGLAYPVQNTGLLVGGTSMLALTLMFLYFQFSPKIKNKKFIIIPGCLTSAIIRIWMMKMPPDVSITWLLVPLFLRGALLLSIALPVGGSTFSLFSDEDYTHGYRFKNIVKQLTFSFSTASVIMIEQHRSALHYSRLAESIRIDSPELRNIMDILTQRLTGIPIADRQTASLEILQKMVITQSDLMSIQDGFYCLAVISVIAAAFSLWQKKI